MDQCVAIENGYSTRRAPDVPGVGPNSHALGAVRDLPLVAAGDHLTPAQGERWTMLITNRPDHLGFWVNGLRVWLPAITRPQPQPKEDSRASAPESAVVFVFVAPF